MAFVAIDPASIEVGDALKAELFTKIKSNEDDLNTRLNNIEASASKIELFEFFVQNATSANSFTGIYYLPIKDTMTITNAYVTIFEKGSLSGALEIDIKKSTDGTMDEFSFFSVFSTKPKITYASASDYDKSTNQVFSPGEIDLVPGDYLRLDVTELPTNGVVGKFLVTCYGE